MNVLVENILQDSHRIFMDLKYRISYSLLHRLRHFSNFVLKDVLYLIYLEKSPMLGTKTLFKVAEISIFLNFYYKTKLFFEMNLKNEFGCY